MVHNQDTYDQAVSLRKRGFTLAEIAKYCDISKSTASKWLQNKPFSATVTKQNTARAGQENAKRLRLITKARSSERTARAKDVAASAKVEFKNYEMNPEFRSGLMAYIAAGDTVDENKIRLSSSSLFLHRQFISFAKDFLAVDAKKIHLWLLLYAGVNEEKAMKQWSKQTKVPFGQFYKNQYVKNSPSKPLHFGVGNTIIGSTYHKQKLLTWVQLAEKQW